MSVRLGRWLWGVVVLQLLGCQQASVPEKGPREPARPATIAQQYGQLPMSFEANQGQEDEVARFVARGPGYTLLLGTERMALVLAEPTPDTGEERRDGPRRAVALMLRAVGAREGIIPQGEQALGHSTNHFRGSQPEQWHLGVPSFSRVRYPEVYPGVDLIFYGNQGQLEFDFVVAPGADPHAVALRFDGAEGLDTDPQGDLRLRLEGGEVRLLRPLAYQELDGQRQVVASRYVLGDKGQVRMEVADYDRARPLVVDPLLLYSTYLGGGNGTDEALAITVDGSGQAYVAGSAFSSSFPTTPGAFDTTSTSSGNAFVSKLNAAGNALVYSTLLEGTGNNDSAFALAVDGSGNAYVTGFTYSTNFPVTPGAYKTVYSGSAAEAFVTKLNPTGSALVYSTFLGGSDMEFAYGVGVDAQGRATVTGHTRSTNFPTLNAFQSTCSGCTASSGDAFVTQLNAAGSALVYSTFLGGSSDDHVLVGGSKKQGALTLDAAGNAYVVGTTSSTNFPTLNAFQPAFAGGASDVFITQIIPPGAQPTATIGFSTYLGGNGTDQAFGVALDGSGNVYVAGPTSSTNFPTLNAFQPTRGGGSWEGFVARLNPSGSALGYSSYLGGSGDDQIYGLAVDGGGRAVVVGRTTSGNFPLLNSSQGLRGTADAFVTLVNASGNGLQLSAYLGGSSDDAAYSVAVDGAGNPYVAGSTRSTDFPTLGAIQGTTSGSFEDAFIAKVNASATDFSLTPTVSSRTLAKGGWATYPISTAGTGSLTFSVSGLPPGSSAYFSAWTLPAGTSTALNVQTLEAYVAAGRYLLTITATDGTLTAQCLGHLDCHLRSGTGPPRQWRLRDGDALRLEQHRHRQRGLERALRELHRRPRLDEQCDRR